MEIQTQQIQLNTKDDLIKRQASQIQDKEESLDRVNFDLRTKEEEVAAQVRQIDGLQEVRECIRCHGVVSVIYVFWWSLHSKYPITAPMLVVFFV